MTKKIVFTALFIGVIMSVLLKATPAHALSGSSFMAGRIIDDSVFVNKSSLSVGDIQAFLNSKVPNCDNDGSQTIYDNSYGDTVTRAVYSARRGNYAKFVCIGQYRENPNTGANNAAIPRTPTQDNPAPYYGDPNANIPGSLSAAEIIWQAAQNNGINPKVLMVMLQKEQGLMTDDWPWYTNQYKHAMGYLCSDSAPCDASREGFYNQVSGAAWQLRHDFDGIDTPGYWAPYGKGQNNIRYSPNSSCGTKPVNIENQATAVLYKYTPYTPNDAALNNLYGAGDGCSSYGNRNFWRLFTEWFDFSTTYRNGISVNIDAAPYLSPAVGQTISYTVTYKNSLSDQVTLDRVGVIARAGSVDNGFNRDFGWIGPITLAPGASRQFIFSTTVVDTGQIFMWPAIYKLNEFIQYNNWGSTVIGHTPNLSLSAYPSVNSSSPYVGQDVTFTASIKNNEPFPIKYDALGIPVRYNSTSNYDSTWVGPAEIAAGGEQSLSGTRTLDKLGQYSYWVSWYFGGKYTTISPTKSVSSIPVTPNFSVSALSLSNSAPVVGETLTASFTITNNLPVGVDVGGVGVVGRFGTLNGANRDIDWRGPVHFNANETKTFSNYSRVISDLGTHYYWIGIYNNGGYIQFNNWGSTVVSKAP